MSPIPDIVLLSTDRLVRAPLCAQLIEDGFDVLGTAEWPTMRRHLRPGRKPRLAIVDLRELPEPSRVVEELGLLMAPSRAIVLTALGTVKVDALRRAGFIVVRRPVSVGEVVTVVRRVLGGLDDTLDESGRRAAW